MTGRPVANIPPPVDALLSHPLPPQLHEDKRDLVTRLGGSRASRGIQRLVEDEAYCLDILQQVEAMTAAADQVALLVLEDHIDGWLTHAVESGQGQPYVDEVMAVVRRTMGRRGPRSGTAARDRECRRGEPALPARSLPLAHWASKAAELLPEIVSCSPPRSISGSRPSTGSSHSRRAPARADSVSRCCHFRTCQFWRSTRHAAMVSAPSLSRSSSHVRRG